MSLSPAPIDGRLLRHGGAFLLAGLLSVTVQVALVPTSGALANAIQNAVAICHVIGMSLCTAACLPRTWPIALGIGASWGGLHVLKELSEHPLLSAKLLASSPDWLRAIWLVDDGGQFVLRDRFEPMEVVLPIAAAAAAVSMIRYRSSEK